MSTPSSDFKAAGHPFADADADIILRSSDNVDFHVHRLILSKASPVFSDILTISSSTSDPDTSDQPPNVDELKDGIPIVCMAESQAVLDTVLRLSYPADKPSISSELSFVRALFQAMDKYAMVKTFPQTLESVILETAVVHPFPAYAIACHCQMFEIANRIARVSLLHPLDFSSSQLSTEDLDLMTSSQYHQLLRYRQQSAAAVLEPVQSLKWLQPSDVPGLTLKPPDNCTVYSKPTSKAIGDTSLSGVQYAPNWVMLYLEQCEAALRLHSHSDTVLDDSIVLPSILRAGACSICRSSANGLRPFSRRLEKELQSAIDTVSNDTMQPHSGNFSDAEHVSVGAASLSIGHAVEDSIEDFMYG